jgi:hypothetical protein
MTRQDKIKAMDHVIAWLERTLINDSHAEERVAAIGRLLATIRIMRAVTVNSAGAGRTLHLRGLPAARRPYA